jgi:hypothetical protein
MAAPLVAVVVGFLTGATLPAAGGAALLGGYAPVIVAIDGRAAKAYAIEQKVCPAADAAADKLADAADARAKGGKHRILAWFADRLARDADIVCRNATTSNTPAGRLVAAGRVLADIAKADGLVPPAVAPTPADPPPQTHSYGR